MNDRNDWIAARAYFLWELDGRPFGQDDFHWKQAVIERDLLELTRASADGQEVLDRARTSQTSGLQLSKSVLVVEDQPELRYNTVDFLEQAGYRVLEAANADEALIHLRNSAVDTLYTDIDMPGSMDGLGLVAKVRATWPGTRIIVTSGLVRLSHGDMETGVLFIPKPTAGVELLNLMTRSA